MLWQRARMNHAGSRLAPKLLDSLYVEAMVLADEARTYFDRDGREHRLTLDPLVRVAFCCESLKVTTRLMHIIAWLLAHRAQEAGDVDNGLAHPPQRLGNAPGSDSDLVGRLPSGAAELIDASQDLYARVQRLDQGHIAVPRASPARSLMSLLERSL